jgi:hypothetical protein
MLNATKHFIKRWAERIAEVDEQEIGSYTTKNREKIIADANQTFQYAKFIYKGQIGDNVTRNYYIKDTIVFVTNVTDDALVTVYRVDMGFPWAIQVSVVDGLMNEINALNEERATLEKSIEQELQDKEHDAAVLADQIAIAEQQLKALRDELNFNKLEQANLKKATLNIGLELKKYALMLVNSKEFKKDLQSMSQ